MQLYTHLTCPYCGRPLKMDEKRNLRYCPHCSSFQPRLLLDGGGEE